MKCFIINYNRITLTKQLADWCADKGLDVVIVDNGSSYLPLYEYYDNCPYPVIHLNANYGSHVVWDTNILSLFGISEQYIVTDPDLDLTAIPDDFLDVMKEGLKRYPGMIKCGLSLEINDLPNTTQGEYIKNSWELKYWKKPLDEMFFNAPTASTFALYREGVTKWKLTPSIRTNRPYTAKHVPWYYTDFNSLPEDEKYYYNTTNDRWATGKERIKEL